MIIVIGSFNFFPITPIWKAALLKSINLLIRETTECELNNMLPIHNATNINSNQQFKSLKPTRKFVLKLIFRKIWRTKISNNLDKSILIENSMELIPGYDLSRRDCIVSNRLNTRYETREHIQQTRNETHQNATARMEN